MTTPSQSMVKAIASTLRAELATFEPDVRVSEISSAELESLGYAALTAMLDATPGMIEAGRWPAEDDGPLACWQAMITAALNEEEG